MKLKNTVLYALLFIIVLFVIFNISYKSRIYINLAKADTICTTKECLKQLVLQELPYMYDIVECESGFRHFDQSGDVLKSHTDDFGLFQISTYFWQDTAIRLGYDIMTPRGNIEMAKYILKVQGINAWVCNRIVNERKHLANNSGL